MAKKRRKEEEEEFHLPEFNETEFLRKEITSAKMILLVVLLAIVAAVISYVLTLAGIVVVAFFAGLALVLLLKYIPEMFGIDTSKLERKDWFGYGSTYFFAWLAIWVLVMNVPFSDVTPPGLVVFVNGIQAGSPQMQVNNGVVNITAKATDNAGIATVMIQVGTADQVTMSAQGGDIWFYQFSKTGNVLVTVTAEDINQHSTSVSITLY
jgi:hypothetical protein